MNASNPTQSGAQLPQIIRRFVITAYDDSQNGRHSFPRIVSAAKVKTIRRPVKLSDLLVKILHFLVLVRHCHTLEILVVSDCLKVAAYKEKVNRVAIF